MVCRCCIGTAVLGNYPGRPSTLFVKGALGELERGRRAARARLAKRGGLPASFTGRPEPEPDEPVVPKLKEPMPRPVPNFMTPKKEPMKQPGKVPVWKDNVA